VAAKCGKLGLSPIFLTDHNTIDGALRISMGDAKVVAGEEVMTRDGELIGLFLTEEIPTGLSANEAARRIKAQDGLVYLEHPYDAFRRHLSEEAVEQLADLIDIVEVWNGRSDNQINPRAMQLCEVLGAAPGGGSDAHRLRDIGSVCVELEDFEGAQDFLAKLRRSTIVKRRVPTFFPKIRRP
jgi:predicted metal-dependent phosphoesterase TrpH